VLAVVVMAVLEFFAVAASTIEASVWQPAGPGGVIVTVTRVDGKRACRVRTGTPSGRPPVDSKVSSVRSATTVDVPGVGTAFTAAASMEIVTVVTMTSAAGLAVAKISSTTSSR
jgi:hypothetical protein